jgi:type IV secretion system protein VirB4
LLRTEPKSRKDTGHTLICGPTGSGKTVFIGFLVAMLSSRGATQVIFDKDRGLEILVRALDGEYNALQNGAPTGFSPLRLDPTPLNIEFLKSWLRVLVRPASGHTLMMRSRKEGNGIRRHAGAFRAVPAWHWTPARAT